MNTVAIDRALFPVARNAIRLLEDAELMFKNDRYPTAVSLAICSIEEAGKFVIRSREASHGKTPAKRQFAHKSKHYELGWFYWRWAVWKVLLDTFDEFKSWVKEQTDKQCQEVYGQIKDLDKLEAIAFVQRFMFSSESEMEKYVKEKFQHPELLDIRGMAQSERIEELRRTGLYCDIDCTYKVTRNPDTVGRAEAEQWLNHARFAMSHMNTWHKILTEKAQPATPPYSESAARPPQR